MIISPLEYVVIVSVIMFTIIFLIDYIPGTELKIITIIILYALSLFFGMATSGGGNRRKGDDSPPTDEKRDEIIINNTMKDN